MAEKNSRGVFSGVLLALVVFFIVLPIGGLVVCVACGRAAIDAKAAHGEAGPLQEVASGAVPIAPSNYVFSMALFSKSDELAMCLDKDVTDDVRDRITEGGSWEAIRNARADEMNAPDAASWGGAGTSTAVLQEDCEHAFGDRLVLASCSDASVRVSYYSFDVLKTDIEMRDCIKSGRHWTALPRDSQEYKRAKARHDVEKAQRDMEKLRGKYATP